jgi:hypothetical protein
MTGNRWPEEFEANKSVETKTGRVVQTCARYPEVRSVQRSAVAIVYSALGKLRVVPTLVFTEGQRGEGHRFHVNQRGINIVVDYYA